MYASTEWTTQFSLKLFSVSLLPVEHHHVNRQSEISDTWGHSSISLSSLSDSSQISSSPAKALFITHNNPQTHHSSQGAIHLRLFIKCVSPNGTCPFYSFHEVAGAVVLKKQELSCDNDQDNDVCTFLTTKNVVALWGFLHPEKSSNKEKKYK